jgi:hypothetical protein
VPQPRIATEIELIADYLDEQLAALANAAHGLTEKQGRAARPRAQHRPGRRGHGAT